MAYPKTIGTKENKFSHIKGLSQNPKVYLNLKGSKDHSLIATISTNQKALLKKGTLDLR